MNFIKNSKAITLIALVITIIVLLILAGVSLNLILGNQGILNQAETAVEEHKSASVAEEIELAMAELQLQYYKDANKSNVGDYATYASQKLTQGVTTASGKTIKLAGTILTYGGLLAGTFDTSTGDVAVTPSNAIIPEGLQIGSEVSYSPSGTYNWQAQYASSDLATDGTADVTLSSATGEDFNITTWKVFKIKSDGTVQLVPRNATTGTVRLHGANGYNNATKLLNDACSSLYSNSSKGITARSINMEDIESVSTYNPAGFGNGITRYGKQYSSAHTTNKSYPTIYASEKKNVIDGVESEGTLGLSDSANDWVTGSITAETSIQPYQTYYFNDTDTFQSKLGTMYYSLLVSSEAPKTYWVASRCVTVYDIDSQFFIRYVSSGGWMNAATMFKSSNSNSGGNKFSMFPVVSLSFELIGGDSTSGFIIE